MPINSFHMASKFEKQLLQEIITLLILPSQPPSIQKITHLIQLHIDLWRMDGWYCDDDKSRSGSSSGSLPQSLLESYGLSFCNNENRLVHIVFFQNETIYVSWWMFVPRDYVSLGHKGEDCLDLENSETLNSISMQLQQQSYEVNVYLKVCIEKESLFFLMDFFSLYCSRKLSSSMKRLNSTCQLSVM